MTERLLPPDPLVDEKQNALSVSFPHVVLNNKMFVTVEDCMTLTVVISGTAGNEDAEFLQRKLNEIEQHVHMYRRVVLDVRELAFCYSQCVKLLMSFGQDRPSRDAHVLEFLASKKAWQVTSLRALASFCPNCKFTVAEEEPYFGPTDPDYYDR
eukprot:TRINITY_DN23643_c0_g1_i1.p2 TRINITY_DN23643_c0_g1~~TRINITY_DN23643_c0_g1_i1.p2  ORF type:complete len:154 (-),score=51.42 TRINITY_DN23643_c0_g1_i1:258-719(-)